MNKIQQTEDYSSFKRIEGNRTINKAQVKKLYDSFNEHPDIASAVPITVNDKMEIVDGQHRFAALKQLGLPIWFYQVDGLKLEDVQRINSSTKSWAPSDYARSFAELGNENYKIYLEFKNTYHLTHMVLLMILTSRMNNSGATTATFRKGKFVVGDLKLAHRLAKQLDDIKRYYARGDTRVFALAFKRIATNPQYNHGQMIDKFVLFKDKFLKDSPYVEEYMRQLEKIYNHHNAIENRVKLF